MDDLVYRLRKRAEIRAQIATRKSVQEGKPDRIGELLLEAADRIESVERQRDDLLDDERTQRWMHGHGADCNQAFEDAAQVVAEQTRRATVTNKQDGVVTSEHELISRTDAVDAIRALKTLDSVPS